MLLILIVHKVFFIPVTSVTDGGVLGRGSRTGFEFVLSGWNSKLVLLAHEGFFIRYMSRGSVLRGRVRGRSATIALRRGRR